MIFIQVTAGMLQEMHELGGLRFTELRRKPPYFSAGMDSADGAAGLAKASITGGGAARRAPLPRALSV